eukprot:TRINITY_DN4747_c0_g1_i1.p1 TRINITY_DN4747_c0_g1~~TRINITY_DN4747_c0_g1_i1.p1  ORF type:complete len:152 (+),score=19.18 TRINITY_DN4747_c0_g1_i1:335-790(+)
MAKQLHHRGRPLTIISQELQPFQHIAEMSKQEFLLIRARRRQFGDDEWKTIMKLRRRYLNRLYQRKALQRRQLSSKCTINPNTRHAQRRTTTPSTSEITSEITSASQSSLDGNVGSREDTSLRSTPFRIATFIACYVRAAMPLFFGHIDIC